MHYAKAYPTTNTKKKLESENSSGARILILECLTTVPVMLPKLREMTPGAKES